MGSKVHVHMQVSDLTKSRAFYERFFGGAPVKMKPGYVKFLPDWAPVNLALSQGRAGGEGTVDHMGIQVDAPATVMVQLQRVKAAGVAVREEMGVHCCHANQDNFWAPDAGGVERGVYSLKFDLEGAATVAASPPNGMPAVE